MTELLFISLLALAALTLKLFKDITSPTLIFLSGFVVSSFMALLYKDEWSLELHSKTYIILVLGGLVFMLTECIYRKKHRFSLFPVKDMDGMILPISNVKLFVIFAFQIVAYLLIARAKMSVVSFEANVAEAVGYINEQIKLDGETFALPWYINVLNGFCRSLGFLFSVLFPLYSVASVSLKTKWLVGLNMLLAILGSFLSGGRMGSFIYIISIVIFYLIFHQAKLKKRESLSRKAIYIIGGIFLFSFAFNELGYLIGRGQDNDRTDKVFSASYVFAMYCGAEIKNLDDFVAFPERFRHRPNDFFAEKTLGVMYEDLGKRFGDAKKRTSNLDFNSVNGYPLGNVYTTYYPFLLDFKYGGLMLVILASLIINVLYKRIHNVFKRNRININLSFLFFSYFIGRVFLMFFSNNFYEGIAIEGIIRIIIFWYVSVSFYLAFLIRSF